MQFGLVVRNDIYKFEWARIPTRGYFLALCVIINATFARLQIFIVSKATSVDRSFNLNSVLLIHWDFPTTIMSCQQVSR